MHDSRPTNSAARGALWFLAFVAVLLASGCDATFDPVAESDRDRAFSVFGYLDPHADTQWIRVGPLRPYVFTSPEPNGITVSLEELGTGRTLVLRDSVFQYVANENVGSAGVFAHNYWTTDPIIPGETYLFTATASNGDKATAVVPVPADFRVTVLLQQYSTSTSAEDFVRIEGVPTVAFVRVRVRVHGDCDDPRQELRYEVPLGSTDPHTVQVSKKFVIPDCEVAVGQDLWIVGAGSPWPRVHLTGRSWHPASASFGMIDLPASPANAVGHLAGVLIKTIPYEFCQVVGQPPLPAFCELTYDGTRAMVTGVIRDACRGFVIPADVRLVPLAFDSAGQKKVRYILAGLQGDYRIAALEPGVLYQMTVSHSNYIEHTDTLVFGPGEHAMLDIALQRVGPC